MSRVPYLPKPRWACALGNMEIGDGMYRDGFMILYRVVMGQTAEKPRRAVQRFS